jgi:ABC-type dipeptide/oligopeptide/nickel transport system permease component
MAFTLVSTVAYVVINMVVDLLYPLFNVQARR